MITLECLGNVVGQKHIGENEVRGTGDSSNP
jgi:hypothetical protein